MAMKRATPMTRRGAAVVAAGLFAFSATACSGSGDDARDTPAETTRPSARQSAQQSTGTQSTGGQDTGSQSASGTETKSAPASTGGKKVISAQPAKGDLDLRTQEFTVTAADAVDIATRKLGTGGILHAVELNHSSSAGGYTWDVKILKDGNDHKVVVDAVSGTIVKDESEKTSDEEKAIDLTSPMTLDEAMKLATAKVDGPVREWKLEYDDNARAYQFDIARDGGAHTTEVTVNVDTKQVTVD